MVIIAIVIVIIIKIVIIIVIMIDVAVHAAGWERIKTATVFSIERSFQVVLSVYGLKTGNRWHGNEDNDDVYRQPP